MVAYARTPSALTWLRVNHLINGLHKQISWKNCLYADNLCFTLDLIRNDVKNKMAAIAGDFVYRIAGFCREDFNLAIGSIRDI